MLYLVTFNAKRIIIISICLIILFSVSGIFVNNSFNQSIAVAEDINGKKYIKWVSFDVTYPALKKAMDLDIISHNKEGYKHNWIEILSYLGAKYGGKFTRYKESDMNTYIQRLESGETVADITKDMKFYTYYLEAYTAVLSEFVGDYKIQVKDADGNIQWQDKYGLKAFSPIAAGYNYNDYDDFGAR